MMRNLVQGFRYALRSALFVCLLPFLILAILTIVLCERVAR